MRGLVAKNKRQFVLIARLGDQPDGQDDNRPTQTSHGLKRVRRLAEIVIDDDLVVTIQGRIGRAAGLFRDRFYPSDHHKEIRDRLLWRGPAIQRDCRHGRHPEQRRSLPA